MIAPALLKKWIVYFDRFYLTAEALLIIQNTDIAAQE